VDQVSTRERPATQVGISRAGAAAVPGEAEPVREAGRGRRLGAGRSGEVWLVETVDGPAAVKVFAGDTLSNLIHYLLTGAPNPYIWNEDAIRCAHHRRKVIGALVDAWFRGRLHVADSYGVSWNEETRAWQLATEFSEGDPLPLLHPYRDSNPEVDELREEILEPLQERLIEAGIDGAVWQAGRGNPVGLNNFLLVDEENGEHSRFAFIDVESGVPALFPMNPLDLFRFYLPRSFHHRQALFDDVDVERLASYLQENETRLREALGDRRFACVEEDAERLGHHQARWRGQCRSHRGIEYQWRKGRLSDERAAYFRRHTVEWIARELGRASYRAVLLLLVRLPIRIGNWVLGISVPAILRNIGRFVSSQQYRTNIGRKYVRGRVREWRKRGQLEERDARTLLEELRSDEASAYLTDFGAHVGMKATFQLLEFTVFAALVATGVLPVWFIPVVIALDGLIYRTAYTLYRMSREAAARRPLPWVALFVGLIPLLGSLAFPAQMVFSANARREDIPRFIIYDTLTRLGVKLPIWGGKDTYTEHVLNRFADRLVRRTGSRGERARAA
jgi:hypothetical protein